MTQQELRTWLILTRCRLDGRFRFDDAVEHDAVLAPLRVKETIDSILLGQGGRAIYRRFDGRNPGPGSV